MKRDALIDSLQKKAMRITLTKLNAEERVMDCSLQEHIIPPTKLENRKENEDVLPVFDINKGEWRSFRTDSIIKAEKLQYQDYGVL